MSARLAGRHGVSDRTAIDRAQSDPDATRRAKVNLHRLLKQREERGEPLRIGLIGAGKFGSMFLSQVRHTPGMRVVAIADLSPERARDALRRVGWADSAIASLRYFDDARRMIEEPDIDIVIDATGSPSRRHRTCTGVLRARQAHRHGQRRGRCTRRSAAGAAGARGGHRLLARVRRSAGADLRTGRLGARLRVRGHRRRQGHQVSAGVSRIDASDGVAVLRAHAKTTRGAAV